MIIRIPLPARRQNWTQRVRIGGQTIRLTVGKYDDGRPGEALPLGALVYVFLRQLPRPG